LGFRDVVLGLTRISVRVLQDGRVTVNGERAQPSLRLKSGDVLQLDGKVRPLARFSTSMACCNIHNCDAIHDGDAMYNGAHVHGLAKQRVEWEPLAVASEQGGEQYVYFKYHKPLNVASTWDKNDLSSMLHFMPPDLLTRKGGGEGQPITGRIPTNDFMLQRRQQQMGEYRGA